MPDFLEPTLSSCGACLQPYLTKAEAWRNGAQVKPRRARKWASSALARRGGEFFPALRGRGAVGLLQKSPATMDRLQGKFAGKDAIWSISCGGCGGFEFGVPLRNQKFDERGSRPESKLGLTKKIARFSPGIELGFEPGIEPGSRKKNLRGSDPDRIELGPQTRVALI